MSDEIRKLLILMLSKSANSIDIEDVEELAAKMYVEYIEPLDLPGPDEIIDPILQKGFVWSMTALVLALQKQVREGKANDV